jgi:hypothetical protein
LGSICRKFFADRFGVAYLGSGAILPRYGNHLDHPFETLVSLFGGWARVRAAALSV